MPMAEGCELIEGETLIMTEAVSLELEPRTTLGKKVNQLRRQGLIPVHLYGRGMESRPLQGKLSDVLRALSQTEEGSPVALAIAGESAPVMASPREIQWDPKSDRLLHVDFIRI